MRIAAVSLCLFTMAIPAPLAAQSHSFAITNASIGADGRVHVEENGRKIVYPKERGQVSAEWLQVQGDGHAAGWLIDESNCCTSYPIPTRLVVISDGGKRVLSAGQMIYGWSFVADGAQVALSIGPTHGETIPHFLLYDTRSGRKLEEWWASESNTPAPLWSRGLPQ